MPRNAIVHNAVYRVNHANIGTMPLTPPPLDSAPTESLLFAPSAALRRQTVATGFIEGMLAGMARRGLDWAPILAAAGIPLNAMDDRRQRVSLVQCEQVYTGVINCLDDEGFGLFSQALPRGFFEFFCRALLSSPTLEEALSRASRYLRVVLPDIGMNWESDGIEARLILTETRRLSVDPLDPARVFAFEWLLRHLHGLFCWLVGRGIPLDSVTFPYPMPDHGEDYRLLYTADSRFGGVRLDAVFRPSLLELPVRRDEASLAKFLVGAPAKLTSLYRHDREMVNRVRDLLKASFPAAPTIAEAASHLHVSTRTLHRRLDEEGSSYQAIRQALRRDMAIARLRNTRKPVAEIAAELGYAEPSAFYRAFVAWTGMSPTEYRARLVSA